MLQKYILLKSKYTIKGGKKKAIENAESLTIILSYLLPKNTVWQTPNYLQALLVNHF